MSCLAVFKLHPNSSPIFGMIYQELSLLFPSLDWSTTLTLVNA